MEIGELGKLSRRANRATVLYKEAIHSEFESPFISTPEHLLATLLFFADQPFDIQCDVSELPGLDGSALGFREVLAQLSPQCAVEPRWREYPSDLHWNHHWSYGHVRVQPAANFRIRYILDRAPLHQNFLLDDPQVAWSDILPARSFAYHREWEQALTVGQMLGAGLDSGLLLAESEAEHQALLSRHSDWQGGAFPLLNQLHWRMEDEPAKHKILDVLGDLALAGLALPKLDIEIRNGGHWTNHMLLDKLSLN